MQPTAWMFSSFHSQSSSGSIQTQKAIQQQGWEAEGGKGHLSYLCMELIVHLLSVYFPHPTSSPRAPHPAASSATFTTLFSLPPFPTCTILFYLLNVSPIVVVMTVTLAVEGYRKYLLKQLSVKQSFSVQWFRAPPASYSALPPFSYLLFSPQVSLCLLTLHSSSICSKKRGGGVAVRGLESQLYYSLIV